MRCNLPKRALTLIAPLLVTVVPVSATPAANRIEVDSREAFLAAIDRAQPGTTICLAPGTYRGGLQISNLQGSVTAPIVVTAADPDHPPVIRGGGTCLQLSDAAHLELSYLVFCDATGNGLNIDDGGSYDTPAHHIRLRHLAVRDVGPQGNRDGIKLSGVDDFEVEACVVERWGDAGSAIDMVGCHRGRITDCTFRYRDDVAANGVQTKGGSSDIVIEQCRFEHAGSRSVNIGGSTGMAYFRPGPQGYEARDITVQDSFFLGSAAPIAFVGVDGALVRRNRIHHPQRWIIRILQETRDESFVPCRNGRFEQNVVVFRGDEVRSIVNIGPGTKPESFRFAENHWYREDRPEVSDQLSLPTPERGATYGVKPPESSLKLEE